MCPSKAGAEIRAKGRVCFRWIGHKWRFESSTHMLQHVTQCWLFEMTCDQRYKSHWPFRLEITCFAKQKEMIKASLGWLSDITMGHFYLSNPFTWNTLPLLAKQLFSCVFSFYVRHLARPVLKWHQGDQPKKKKKYRDGLNHMFQNKEQSSQQAKYAEKCSRGLILPSGGRQNGCIAELRVFRWSCWLDLDCSSAGYPGITQLEACSKVGWRS